jgi:hypothetical protein
MICSKIIPFISDLKEDYQRGGNINDRTISDHLSNSKVF